MDEQKFRSLLPRCAPSRSLRQMSCLGSVLNNASICCLIFQPTANLNCRLYPLLQSLTASISLSTTPFLATLSPTFSSSPLIIIPQPIVAESCRRRSLFNKPNQRNPLQQSLLAPVSSSIVGIDAFASHYCQVKGDAPRKSFQPTIIICQPIAAESCHRLFLFNEPNQRSPLLQTLPVPGLSSLVDMDAFALRLLFVSSRVDVQGNVVSTNFFNIHYREDRPSNDGDGTKKKQRWWAGHWGYFLVAELH